MNDAGDAGILCAAPEAAPTGTSRVCERIALAVLGTAWLLAVLPYAVRLAPVWMDEAMYTDPAVNLISGRGFTSSAWYAQDRTEFWAGNTPLHPALLALSMKSFGFHRWAVQAFNASLTLGAVLVIVSAARRYRIVSGEGQRLTLAAFLLSCYSIHWVATSGRYDALGMFLAALALWSGALADTRARLGALFAAGALMPWAGLQLVFWASLVCLLLVIVVRPLPLPEVIAFGLGVLLGGLALVGLYAALGVLPGFLRSIAPHSGATSRRSSDAIGGLLERTNLLLLGTLVLCAALLTLRGDRPRAARCLFGVAFGLAIPALMALAGKFSVYYTWMATVPMALILFGQLGSDRVGYVLAAGLVAVAVLTGLPLQIALKLRHHRAFDYRQVERLVGQNVRPGESVFADEAAFYPIRRRTGEVFFTRYLNRVTPAEAGRIGVIIGEPGAAERAAKRFGGAWVEVDRNAGDRGARGRGVARPAAMPYPLVVLRRKP
jgi:hypothetical protein